MHPLQTYLRNLKIAALSQSEYQKNVKALADTVGVSVGFMCRLHYPKQSKLLPEKALRMELATNGQVPANSVCDGFDEFVRLLEKVEQMKENNRVAAGN